MDFESPKDNEGKEARQLSPEEAVEFLADMEKNVAGLEAWLEEERDKLSALEADPKANPQELNELRSKIWELAEDIQEQKDFIKEGGEE